MSSLRIGYKPLFLFAITLILIFCGSLFSGRLFLGVFIFLALLFAFLLVQFAVMIQRARFTQSWSTQHPAKGEKITFGCIAVNESPLPSCPIRVRFRVLTPLKKTVGDEDEFLLGAGEKKDLSRTVSCPFRGVYEIGMENVSYHHMLGFFRFTQSSLPQTFYVYPRLINASFSGRFLESTGLLKSRVRDEQTDPSIFRSIDPYRDGESVRNVYWKKYFTTGNLFVKTPESSVNPGLDLLVDLQKIPLADDALRLESADITIEAALALSFFCVEQRIPCTVHFFTPGHQVYAIRDAQSLDILRKKTITLFFEGETNAGAQMETLRSRNLLRGSSLVCVTHNLTDPALFTAMQADRHFILNAVGQKESLPRLRDILNERRLLSHFLFVSSGETIREDLCR